MAMNKAWMAIAWFLAIAALPACATSGNETSGTGGSSSSGTTSGGGGEGGQIDTTGSGGGGGGDGGAACGDGKLATTETCDDGNILDGDGCSGSCELEKGFTCTGTPTQCSPICGDGLLVSDEICDDGNLKKGDGCSVKCGVEDGWNCDAASPSKCSSVCGDGLIAGKEECDDGDTNSDDGCSDACLVEPGYSCVSAPSLCKAQCGDGVLALTEACDDHNFAPGDGCSDTCDIEEYWTCSGAPSACVTPCGDGHVLGPEKCDDGNNAADDGCTATCTFESGWSCSGEPSACATSCGDGIIAGTEKCDDGNAKGNDGCNINCKIEPGWTCTTSSPSACATICGDGFPVGPEGCDDKNTVNGDGCSATCQPETGYVCSNIPSICITLCGDGILGGAEQCDDGNTANNDGCTATCAIQQGWTCTSTAGMATVCTSICGDGLLVGAELCDDANTADGDCCSSICQAEAGCEIELNNELGAANDFDALSVSGVMKGSIKPAGESDFYAITVEPNTTIALTAETLDGLTPNCSSLAQDSTINLYDPNGGLLGTDNNTGPGNCALLSMGALKGGGSGADYFVEVKGSNTTATFTYSLRLTAQITVCGDGTKDLGEQCDDGNTANGDGCNSDCIYETYSEIEPNGTTALATTNGPFPMNSLWSGAIGTVGDLDLYQLDLAATVDLHVETFDGTGPSNCTAADTKIELLAPNGTTSLAIDDDDGVNNCSLLKAQTDPGVRHLYPGSYFIKVQHYSNTQTIAAYVVEVTTSALCGNGTVEGAEQCDGTPDCDANCDLLPICGDGLVSTGEQCDDGNTAPGDGCSATCQIEGLTAEIEPNNTFAEADGLPVVNANTLISGAIGVVGDKDIFKLDVAALSVIRFETFEGLTRNCQTAATTMRLFNSAGTQLKIDAPPEPIASGISNCSALVVRLDPGAYYVQIEQTNNNGTIPSYMLEIQFETSLGSEAEPNESPMQATALNGTEMYVFGDHQLTTDLDSYAITVPAGKSIRAELVEGDTTKSCESNGIDSFMTLFNAAGTALVVDDDDGRGYCSAIDGTGSTPRDISAHNLPAGTYYLQIKAFGSGVSAAFNYNLAITIR